MLSEEINKIAAKTTASQAVKTKIKKQLILTNGLLIVKFSPSKHKNNMSQINSDKKKNLLKSLTALNMLRYNIRKIK